MKSKKQYTWTQNKNYWTNDVFNSIEECIEDAKTQNYSGYIFIGRVHYFEPKIDAINLLFELQEEACWEYGNVAENWEFSRETVEILSERLNKCFKNWLEETNQEPDFYEVCDIELTHTEAKEEVK